MNKKREKGSIQKRLPPHFCPPNNQALDLHTSRQASHQTSRSQLSSPPLSYALGRKHHHTHPQKSFPIHSPNSLFLFQNFENHLQRKAFLRVVSRVLGKFLMKLKCFHTCVCYDHPIYTHHFVCSFLEHPHFRVTSKIHNFRLNKFFLLFPNTRNQCELHTPMFSYFSCF